MEPILTPIEAARAIEDELHAVSGKSVLVHKDSTVPGYASIKIASENSPAHLLRYSDLLTGALKEVNWLEIA